MELVMKKYFFLLTTLSLIASACVLPAAFQLQAATPAPITVADLQKTATVSSQQTLEALPSPTLNMVSETISPSNTPRAATATDTPPAIAPTETQNPILQTLTATLGTGTVISDAQTAAVSIGASSTPNPALTITPTGIAHPLHSGTMPPNLPYGQITLINRSKVEVYISMRCVTKDGYVTIIEYPVRTTVNTDAPAGQYTYVLWVGGRQILGDFGLSKSQELKITIYKDRVQVK
jgi:hypothetical protein